MHQGAHAVFHEIKSTRAVFYKAGRDGKRWGWGAALGDAKQTSYHIKVCIQS